MSKIKLTNSQVKMIQEHEDSIGKRIILKIDKGQYSRLFESKEKQMTLNNVSEGIMDTLTSVDPEFLSNLISTFKSFINDPSQKGLSPFWVKNGVTWGDYKAFLLSTGLFTTLVIGGSEVLKLNRKLINKLPKQEVLKIIKTAGRHLYNKFVENRYDMENGGKVINVDGEKVDEVLYGDDLELGNVNEYGDYPSGAEDDSNAPWNQSDARPEYEMESQENVVMLIKNYGDFGLLSDNDGGKYYIDLMNFHYDPNSDNDFLNNKINVAIESGELELDTKGTKLFSANVISKITSFNKEEFLGNTFDGDRDEIEQHLNNLKEMTTTGSVGGSYVQPLGRKSIVRGGKMIEDGYDKDDSKKLRFVVELDMYIDGNTIEEAEAKGFGITRMINKKFDVNARVTNIQPRKFGSIGENFKKTDSQVSFDDCTKLNNNTVAQDGGCSVGSVDDVVKIEGFYESVALKTGRTVNEVREIIKRNKTKNNG